MLPRAHRVILPIAALLATLPIFIYGPSCGHDFDFHLLSWLEASSQFAHFGFPHWAYTPAWNAGEPRFIFYPPISWTLGGLLGLILPWQLVPAVLTWMALTLSGFTAHRLARRYAGPAAATLASTLYLANPYMLFTAYERTAYAELLAAAWLPLLFAAAMKLGAPRLESETWDRTTSILSIAIPIALLWLTNAPAAVMACYALAFLTLIRLILHSERRRLALTTTAGVALGLLLAAFYILPAAYERKFVQVDLATTTGMRPADHFFFHRMSVGTPGFTPTEIAFHDNVVRTASLVTLTLLAAISLAFALLYTHRRSSVPHSSRPYRDEWVQPFNSLPLLALATLILFLQTPPSAFLWRILPQLHFLQFPWRLDALLAVILCVVTAKTLNSKLLNSRIENRRLSPQAVSLSHFLLSFRSAAEESAFLNGESHSQGAPGLAFETWVWGTTSLLVAAALILPAWHYFHQPCDEEDNVAARVALFHSNRGTDPTDEYTPANADPDTLHPGNPPYWLIPYCYDAPTLFCSVNHDPPHNLAPGPVPSHLVVSVGINGGELVLNRRAFPGWAISIDHQVYHVRVERSDGLMVIVLEAGTHSIDLTFHQTLDRLTGVALSGTTLTLTLLVTLKRRKPPSAPSA